MTATSQLPHPVDQPATVLFNRSRDLDVSALSAAPPDIDLEPYGPRDPFTHDGAANDDPHRESQSIEGATICTT
jgi:hypothetical protein